MSVDIWLTKFPDSSLNTNISHGNLCALMSFFNGEFYPGQELPVKLIRELIAICESYLNGYYAGPLEDLNDEYLKDRIPDIYKLFKRALVSDSTIKLGY